MQITLENYSTRHIKKKKPDTQQKPELNLQKSLYEW